ncbi:unnamed protein product, partial [marine sediment metagenome]
NGGSGNTDFTQLKEKLGKNVLIGAIGIEALIALKRTGINPDYIYGVREAIIEAAFSGLSSLVICTEEGVLMLAQRLEEESLNYEIIDLEKDK